MEQVYCLSTDLYIPRHILYAEFVTLMIVRYSVVLEGFRSPHSRPWCFACIVVWPSVVVTLRKVVDLQNIKSGFGFATAAASSVGEVMT